MAIAEQYQSFQTVVDDMEKLMADEKNHSRSLPYIKNNIIDGNNRQKCYPASKRNIDKQILI